MTSVLGVIMNLRKCCNHPNLFEPRSVISPYVATAIAPKFSKTAFTIKEEMVQKNFLLIGSTFTSQFTWNTFIELEIANQVENSRRMNQSKLHFIDGLKFVKDRNGGHFYKPECLQAIEQPDAIHSLCNGDNNVSWEYKI